MLLLLARHATLYFSYHARTFTNPAASIFKYLPTSTWHSGWAGLVFAGRAGPWDRKINLGPIELQCYFVFRNTAVIIKNMIWVWQMCQNVSKSVYKQFAGDKSITFFADPTFYDCSFFFQSGFHLAWAGWAGLCGPGWALTKSGNVMHRFQRVGCW